MKIESLLVDLDGTLLGNNGLILSLDFVARAVGRLRPLLGLRNSLRTLVEIKKTFDRPDRELTNDIRVVTLMADKLDVTIEEARQILRSGVFQIFPRLSKHFYPIQGAKEFLEWAKSRYPMVLATNPVWPVEIAHLRLEWAGIDVATFRSITHIHRMKACKPAPEYYSEVLEQEHFQAASTLLIGDDVKMDLPATRIGMPVFIVGKYRRVTPLQLDGMKAPAWRGSYRALREILESGGAFPEHALLPKFLPSPA
jgi:FMN phosphatase YigB (HAD superfamily)